MPLPEVFRKKIAPFEAFIQASAARNGVPVELIKGVMFQESRGNPQAKSRVGAKGLMQLMPATAKEVGVENPFDPAQSIEGGAKYLKKQLNQFGDVSLALAAYNAGPGNVIKHKGIPPFRETRNYVSSVLGRAGGFKPKLPPPTPRINFLTQPGQEIPTLAQQRPADLLKPPKVRKGGPQFRTEQQFFQEDFKPLESITREAVTGLKKSLGEGQDFSQIPTGFSVLEEQPGVLETGLSALGTLRKGANIGSAKILQQIIQPDFGRVDLPQIPQQPTPLAGVTAPLQALQAPGRAVRGELQKSIDVSLAEPPTTFQRQFPRVGEFIQTTGEFAPEIAFAGSAPARRLGQQVVSRFGIQTPSIARTAAQATEAGFGGAAGGLARGEPEEAAIGAVAGPLLTFAGAGLGQTAREAARGVRRELPGLAREAQRLARSEAGALRLGDVTPIPETAQTLGLQMKALREGRTRALLVTPGSTTPRVPAGFQTLDTPQGQFIFDPAKVAPEEITQRVQQGTFGELLGLLEPKSQQTTRAVVALQEGVEAKTALVSPKNVQKQIAEFKRQFPGAEIKVGGEDIARDVIAKRAGAPPIDPSKISIEAGPGPATETLNFKLEKLEIPPVAKAEVLNVADQAEKEIFRQRRGVVKWGQTENEARKLLKDGAFTRKVLDAQPGQAFNASELEALGKATATLAQKVSVARQKWLENPLNKVTDEEFKNLLKLQLKFQKTFQGGVAEAGRGLGILRKTKTPQDTIDALTNRVVENLNEDQIEALSLQLAKAGNDPAKQAGVLNEFIESSFLDKAIEYSTAVKLYNPTTHIVNTVSNALSSALNVAERFGASGVNLVESKLRGKPQELFARAAVRDGLAMGRALPSAALSFAKAIGDETFQVAFQRTGEVGLKLGAIKGLKGKVFRTSFRLLNAMDSFFRTLNAQGELTFNAANEGLKKGLNRVELNEFIRQSIANPSEEAFAKANKVASEHLFQTELGPAAKGFSNLLNSRWKPLKFLIPFYKTPVNITKFGGQRSPLGVFSPRNIKDVAKGTPEERALALSRWGLGTIMSSFATWYAVAGNVTANWPKDKGERERWKREGIQPFSFKAGDKWVSYRRLAPFDSMFVLAAKIAEGWNKRGEVPTSQLVGEVILAATKKQLDTPYLQGVSNLLGVMMDDDDFKIERLIASQATGNVPNVIGAVARAKDPVFRAPTGVAERIQAQIPGLREGLPPRVDIFGRVQQKEGTFATRFLNPFVVTTERQTPADRTLAFFDFKPTSLFGQTRGGLKIPNDIYAKHLIEGGKRFEGVATEIAQDRRNLAKFTALSNVRNVDITSKQGGRKVLQGIKRSLGDEHGNNALREYLPQAPEHLQVKFVTRQFKDLGLRDKVKRVIDLQREQLLTPRMIQHLEKTQGREIREVLNRVKQTTIPREPQNIGF